MTHDPDQHASLGAMYSDYFLDYASYVILERAVPHLHDGLKPVQRRILHAMDELDDGRYNKVAGIVGNTMNYTRTGTSPSARPSSVSGRKNCSSTPKETGATPSPATVQPPRVTSRPASRNSQSKSSSTPRPPSGCPATTDAARSRTRCR